MGWKNWSYARKGLLIGIFLGLLFLLYTLLTNCHTSFGGPNGCHAQWDLGLAMLEFLILFPSMILLPILGISFEGVLWKIFRIISPIIFFGLLGLLIGLIVGKIKSSKKIEKNKK